MQIYDIRCFSIELEHIQNYLNTIFNDSYFTSTLLLSLYKKDIESIIKIEYKIIEEQIESVLEQIHNYCQNTIKFYNPPNIVYYDSQIISKNNEILKYSKTPKYSIKYQTIFLDPKYFYKLSNYTDIPYHLILRYILLHEYAHHIQDQLNKTDSSKLNNNSYYLEKEYEADFITGYIFNKLYNYCTNKEFKLLLNFISILDDICIGKQKSENFKLGYTSSINLFTS